jgi:hypothetical protein
VAAPVAARVRAARAASPHKLGRAQEKASYSSRMGCLFLCSRLRRSGMGDGARGRGG